jgi:excisionase family DNA binding protein
MTQHPQGRLILVPPKSMTDAGETERAVYSVREVAHLLSLSLGATYALVRAGEIPARRLGSRWVIPRVRFDQWLDECTVQPEPDPAPPRETSPAPRRPRGRR